MYPSDSSVSTTWWCPLRAASISAVQPLYPVWLMSEGTWDRRVDTWFRSPLAAASRSFSTISSFALSWKLVIPADKEQQTSR